MRKQSSSSTGSKGEMIDTITWEEMERVTSQDSTLQAVMEDIKKGTIRKEARVAKYGECFIELSTAAKMVVRGE